MKKRVAIISPDVMGPIHNGGVGTSCALLAELLASNGYEVDLIFALEWGIAPAVVKKWTSFYKKRGVRFKMLPPFEFELQHGHNWVRLSYRAYEYLKQAKTYDLVIFPDMFGTGYFSQIARQNGLAFQDTNFLISFLGPQVWSKEDNLQLFSESKQMSIPMLERGTVEFADCVQYATEWSIEWVKKHGWKTPEPELVLFPFSKVTKPLPARKTTPKEIVFFGRLEFRKGLIDFLDALELLEETGDLEGREITFLGRAGPILGTPGDKYVRDWSKKTGIKVKLFLDKQSFEAVDYLRKGDTLAVVPSHSETMGYTLIECMSHGIPVICSDIPPFKEILGDLANSGVFKAKSAKSLANIIRSKEFISGAKRANYLHGVTESRWLRLIEKHIKPKKVRPKLTQSGSVSVLIPHFERPDFLREALESLLAQTKAPNEVLVYDDASSTDDAAKIIASMRKAFALRGIRLELFKGKENGGPCKARNILATKATSEFLLFMDDDNRALPFEIETLLSVQKFAAADVVTTAMSKFFDGQENLWRDRRWTPVGFNICANVLENMMGDTNMLMRRSLFERIGGFYTENALRAEDLHLLVRAVQAGAKMTLCPEPLFEYRIHKNNRSRTLDYHASRLINIKNALHREEEDMTSLNHLLLSWSYDHGLIWIDEPPPAERKIGNARKEGVDIMPMLPTLMKGTALEAFGRGYKIDLPKNGRIELDIPKHSKLKKSKAGYLVLMLVAENGGEMVPSNGYQRLLFNSGTTGLTIGLESTERVKMKFKVPGSRVFVSNAWIVPTGAK